MLGTCCMLSQGLLSAQIYCVVLDWQWDVWSSCKYVVLHVEGLVCRSSVRSFNSSTFCSERRPGLEISEYDWCSLVLTEHSEQICRPHLWERWWGFSWSWSLTFNGESHCYRNATGLLWRNIRLVQLLTGPPQLFGNVSFTQSEGKYMLMASTADVPWVTNIFGLVWHLHITSCHLLKPSIILLFQPVNLLKFTQNINFWGKMRLLEKAPGLDKQSLVFCGDYCSEWKE